MYWTTILNFAAWYIFIFIAVVWILVMLQNRGPERERKIKALPKVTVLIPAYNEGKTIAQTIKSVLNLDYPKKLLDIIVINDCSTDRTKSICRKFAKAGTIKLLNNKINRGKAYSLNRAINIAKGEFIACLDADSFVRPDILKKMLPYFSSKNIACVTPALEVYKTKNMLEKIQYAEYVLNVFLRKMLAFIDSVHVTPGVFSIYRKDALVKVGGFDIDNLTEDMEIALKLHKAGYKIENNVNAVSYTFCPNKWKALFSQRIRWYRGALENSVKYKYMFFNPKYGNLGVFFLPMNFISVITIVILFLTVVSNYITLINNFIWKMSLIGWDWSLWIKNLSISTFFGDVFGSPFFLALMSICLGGYLLYVSFKISNISIKKNKPGYFVYLIVFPMILMLFWALAMFYEIFKLKKKW